MPSVGADAACVSGVVGDGPEAHRIVRVGDWTLVARASEEDEPRIRDLDLGSRVYPNAKPHKIRERIRDLMAENSSEFRPLEVFPRPGKTGGRPGSEFWLNEHEAVFLVSQVGTPEARAFTHAMIRVFRLAVRGLLPQSPAADTGAVAALVREAVAEATMVLRDELVSLRAAPLLRECIGREVAFEEIAKPVRALASDAAAQDPLYSRRQHIGRLHVEMREAIGASPKLRLEDFDPEMYKRARGWIRARHRDLERREDTARRATRRKARAAQGSLPLN